MFSIIIPVHNSELYIKECLESIIVQRHVSLEIIVILDHCNDSSEEICNNYSRQDDRIKVFKNKKRGVSSSRNLGIKIAKGEYIVFVDSDDILIEDSLKCCDDAMGDSDLLICGYQINKSGNKKIYNINNKSGFFSNINKLIELSLIQSVWAKCFRRSIINDANICFDEKLDYGEDTQFLYQYMSFSSEINVISSVIYEYRIHGASLSHKYIPDKLFIDSMLCKKIIEVCIGKNQAINEKFIKTWWVCGSIKTFLPSIVASNDYIEYNIIMNKVYDDNYIMSIVSDSVSSNIKWSVLRYLLLNKKTILIYIIYNMMSFYRRNVI